MVSLDATSLLVGVDDTDNHTSRGTGWLVQQLVAFLTAAGVCRALGATRHQLCDDEAIPSTSHNSSACLAVAVTPGRTGELTALAGSFLETRSAPGSDPGLVVAPAAAWADPGVRRALADFGAAAKTTVVDLAAARRLAAGTGLHASGHGGDEGGIIGALAAVGLHLSGSDGFFLWMPGIRSLSGRVRYDALRAAVPIHAALDPDGTEPGPADLVDLGDWVRPVWRDGRAVLLLWAATHEPGPDGVRTVWGLAPRYVVKDY